MAVIYTVAGSSPSAVVVMGGNHHRRTGVPNEGIHRRHHRTDDHLYSCTPGPVCGPLGVPLAGRLGCINHMAKRKHKGQADKDNLSKITSHREAVYRMGGIILDLESGRGPKRGSCLALEDELSEETHLLAKQALYRGEAPGWSTGGQGNPGGLPATRVAGSGFVVMG